MPFTSSAVYEPPQCSLTQLAFRTEVGPDSLRFLGVRSLGVTTVEMWACDDDRRQQGMLLNPKKFHFF